ncbi:hypothetical protein MSM1_20085 [Mycobacterium sp. SM1]|uniref:hypothetical protein n=1 Tax=Mycobacterium sp. SM1 TaxID=2816243 RepID=UPI001BCD1B3B|nr:hypothetical protein [Mycobacterium sp. SM1]MBS4730522.1 hypothetical protein [Mycobacterium sp. SM1]
MHELVNLTPHNVIIVGLDGTITVPPSGTVARCEARTERRGTVSANGVTLALTARAFGEVEGIPPSSPGKIYIVSGIAAQAAWAAGRRDVVCPGEGQRDEAGRIVACLGLSVCP